MSIEKSMVEGMLLTANLRPVPGRTLANPGLVHPYYRGTRNRLSENNMNSRHLVKNHQMLKREK